MSKEINFHLVYAALFSSLFPYSPNYRSRTHNASIRKARGSGGYILKKGTSRAARPSFSIEAVIRKRAIHILSSSNSDDGDGGRKMGGGEMTGRSIFFGRVCSLCLFPLFPFPRSPLKTMVPRPGGKIFPPVRKKTRSPGRLKNKQQPMVVGASIVMEGGIAGKLSRDS